VRIYSKFKDYYDIGLSYGIDPLCHYVRKTEKIEDAHELKEWEHLFKQDMTSFRHINAMWTLRTNYTLGYVLFCGKRYPCVKFKRLVYNDARSVGNYQEYKYFYSEEKLDKHLSVTLTKGEYKDYTSSEVPQAWSKHTAQERIKKYLLEDTKDYMELHRGEGIPIYFVEGATLHKNPRLSGLGFASIVDPHKAFQELSMFISGVLGGQSPAMVEIEDKYRIEAHGFDKFSFRKGKSK